MTVRYFLGDTGIFVMIGVVRTDLGVGQYFDGVKFRLIIQTA